MYVSNVNEKVYWDRKFYLIDVNDFEGANPTPEITEIGSRLVNRKGPRMHSRLGHSSCQ
jgi:hypothetical protein